MTTAIQKIALNKLIGRWSEEGSLSDSFSHFEGVDKDALEENDSPSLRVFTDLIDPVEMTRAEANALRSWFKERGLSEKDHMSLENFSPGQFRILEAGNTTMIRLGEYDDFDPDRDVEHLPKPTGDVQKYHIDLHREDFARLQLEFLREGWFSRDKGQGGDPKPKLPPFEPS